MIRRAAPRPVPGQPPESVCDPFDFLSKLEDLRADSDYEWASDTIEGIYTTVTEKGRVSAGQLRAIMNIEDAVARRRY